MNKICFLLAIMCLASLTADALLFVNFDGAGVNFRVTFRSRKAVTNNKDIYLPPKSSQNVVFSTFQNDNNMNSFWVQVTVGMRAIPCGQNDGDSDNFVASFRNGVCKLGPKETSLPPASD